MLRTQRRPALIFLLSFLSLALLISCGGGGGGSGSSGGTGTLSVGLTDATSYHYQAVYVTIDEIQVHVASEGGWQTIASPEKTYNLLELVNGVRENLGLAELPAGHYTQMRLIIGDTPDDGINLLSESHPFANYVVLDADEDGNGEPDIHELKVPSGPQTGLKIVNGFTISADETTELLLDFDASKSVVQAGSSGKWLLKPVVKVLDTREYARIVGQVSDGDSNGLPQAFVSAQSYNSSAADPADEVEIQTSTLSDDSGDDIGDYALFVEPASYNVVAYAEGYAPECASVTLLEGETLTQDFELAEADTGTISGDVTIGTCGEEVDDSDTRHVTLSFRQVVSCTDDDQVIEVASINVINGGSYEITLPSGSYDVVASTYEETTEVYEDVEVTADGNVELDVCNLDE